MKAIVMLAAAAAIAATSVVIAQESILGKYRGSYQTRSGRHMVVTLDITSVEDGIVKGMGSLRTTNLKGGACRGDYPFTGTLKDGELDVRAEEKGGPAGDCNFRVRATIEGGQLKARFGQNEEFTMSR